MKIYTKTGDLGETSLIGGKRVKKSDLRIEAYGTIDELNSYIGLLRSFALSKDSLEELRHIQVTLFEVGATLANPDKTKTLVFNEANTIKLEQSIDKMNNDLPPMTHFILPGGNQEVAFCHIARTVCRRAERRIVELNEQVEINPLLAKYINRLSDYLFMLSRKIGFDEHVEEIRWEP